MGYWKQGEEGNSFDNDSEMIWGDQPADIIDDAIRQIVEVFKEDVGREPTKEELMAGFKFSLNVYGMVT